MRATIGAAALAALCLACTSNPVPQPGPTGSPATTGSLPPGTLEPGPTGGVTPPDGSPDASATPAVPLPSPDEMVVPGLVPLDGIDVVGNEYAATIYSEYDCDVVAGWLMAGDWLVGESAELPAPSPDAEGNELSWPSVEWLELRRPDDGALVKIGHSEGESGCRGTLSRLSPQTLSATGDDTFSGEALAYQFGCGAEARAASVAMHYFGPGDVRASLGATVPLELGTHVIPGGTVAIGRRDVGLGQIVQLHTGGLGSDVDEAHEELYRGFVEYESTRVNSGEATVTSIDPLVAEVTLSDLQSEDGDEIDVTATIRCDLPGGLLTEVANAPEPTATPEPTPLPDGHLEVELGSRSVVYDGPGVSCSAGLFGSGWTLSFAPDEPYEGLSLVMLTEDPEEWSLTIAWDDTLVSSSPGRGNLEITTQETAGEVSMEATGRTGGGERVRVSAVCGDTEDFRELP
jgi:hypothetical protein